MGRKVINIRGYTFAVEAKSGSQLRFIMNMMEKRTDIELCQYQKEYEFNGNLDDSTNSNGDDLSMD